MPKGQSSVELQISRSGDVRGVLKSLSRFHPWKKCRGTAPARRTGTIVKIDLQISSKSQQAEVLDLATSSLYSDLRDLNIGEVRRPTTGEPSHGTRGLDLIAVGALSLAVAPSIQALTALLELVRGWVKGSDRSVRISINNDEIELSGLSDDERTLLIQEWVNRHGQPEPDDGK